MIHLNCPTCNRKLKAPDSRAGATLPCPACGATIHVLSSSSEESTPFAALPEDSPEILNWLTEGSESPAVSNSPAPPETKQCPFCAETIQREAVKCRFCGEFLDGSRTAASPQAVHYASAHPTQKQKDPGLAAVLSVICPGLGQVYNGQIGIGILLGIVCVLLYFICLGPFMHVWLAYDAYNYADRLNRGTP